MKAAPLILVTPSTMRKGTEFSDASINLSNRYLEAILDAGGVPLVLPCVKSRNLIADYVRRADGVLLTGGDDIQAKYYAKKLPRKLAQTIKETEPERDDLEMPLIDEVFRQRKPLLAICRGHQVLNVALGGTLIVDIPTQVPNALNHKQMDRKTEPVHDVEVAPDSRFAALIGKTRLGVNSTHHQAVDRVASPLRITARSRDGIVEAMELKDPGRLPYLQSVQFHPERLYDRYPKFRELFRSFIRACAGKRERSL